MLRAIGLMSGTSLDGVDAAMVETDGIRVARLGPRLTVPYDRELRRMLRELLDVAPRLDGNAPLVREATQRLTEYHADAVERLGEDADVIGFHGQTILHRPTERRTWQIGDADQLARLTGTRVAYGFRLADIEQGGQGAPLAPVYHAALAAKLDKPLAILNVGGVANVTFIRADDPLIAFDTGPGNGPLDDWAKHHSGGAFDEGGALALAGCADEEVVGRLMSHPYFSDTGPKSLDRLDFEQTIGSSGLHTLSPADGAATLVAFVARSVAVAGLEPTQWLITGGGRHNPAIMRALTAVLNAPVHPVEDVGWDGDALEAQCFGFLAARVLAGLPLSFPGTTGVPAPMPGGLIAQP